MISTGSNIASADEKKADSNASNELLINKTDEIIKQYTDPDWFSGSVAIFKDDKVIYDKSFGYTDIENKVKNTASTKIRIGSINKHFTAALVMQKVQSRKKTHGGQAYFIINNDKSMALSSFITT